ncbi:polysaccharide biosynthesis/export family protein [Mesorhizobium yinganensis]|uniref:polysaccharide biosynthesis/export family protein n=1 Tax=Mesorhizobium yinganensis TaxID=3157707 RepID=UPI0032B74FC5
MSLSETITERARRLTVFAAVLAGCLCAPAATWAAGAPLVAQTKLRLTVIQWMPPKGAYERWDALGGEFEVTQSGTIMLPVIGSVPVANMDVSQLAADIAGRIQKKLMLVEKPETTVEVLDYPPVYVVGDVEKPGEYRFRDGMTVLQALALSGGEFRSPAEKSEDSVKLVGELQEFDADIIRSTARIARLSAEMNRASEISFPAVAPDDEMAKAIFAQERIIFAARANEIKRQTESLGELRGLLTAEVNVLQEKIKASDASIKSAEDELAGVKTLVDKGLAVAARRSDLERTLAGYRTDRLDQITATMRARQGITEATRNADGLLDRQQTEIASSLQSEQANLSKLKMQRDVSQKLLLKTLAASSPSIGASGKPSLAYAITRIDKGTSAEIVASPQTVVMPGDVISITIATTPPKDQAAASSAASQ